MVRKMWKLTLRNSTGKITLSATEVASAFLAETATFEFAGCLALISQRG
jgi:hypothetical protein